MKNILRNFARGTVATIAAAGLAQSVQAQNITVSTSAATSWVGTPVYQTGAAPTTDSGGTSQDNNNWGGNANGTAGFGALAQAFEVTSSGALATAQMVFAGSAGTFNVELYNLGTAPAGYQAAPGNPPTITQINNVGSGGADGVNLLAAGDQFTFGGTGTTTLVTLTFGGADSNVQLVPGNVYVLSLDPTANADTIWWVRGGLPVAAYNTGEGLNADGVAGLGDFEGKTSVRDLDLAVTEKTVVPVTNVNILGAFQGSSDTTDIGWVNPSDGNSITNASEAVEYSFVAAGVAGYAQSLQITATNSAFGADSLELQFSAAQIAAFNSNSYITFTFSVPAWTNGGYSQVFNLALNAPGYGFHGQSWANATESGSIGGDTAGSFPNFYFYNGVPMQTQVVTLNYASVLSAIIAGGESYLQMTFQGNIGGGAPNYIFINNVELSTGPFGTTMAPLPPTLSVQKANPGLRIFAGSKSQTYDREELDSVDHSQSWIGGTYPVSYSFTLQDFPVAPPMQCQIFLIPINSLPAGDNPTGNEFVDYQSSNELWLEINGMAANPNGSSGYNVQVAWKTNTPNSNPTNLALINGNGVVNGIYTNTGNQSPVGTWTLTFSNATSGALTPPGVAALPFTISDPNVSTDFANPVMAVFGLQPNSTAGEGTYIDYASISVSGVAGVNENENFVTDYAAGNTTATTSGLWDITDSAVQASLVMVGTNTPLWVSWTSPAVGYGLAVTPILPAPVANEGNTSGNIGGFVLPQQYNGYFDIPVTVLEANNYWTLIPSDCLPSFAYPSQANAFFTLLIFRRPIDPARMAAIHEGAGKPAPSFYQRRTLMQ